MCAEICRMCGEMTESGVSLLDPTNRNLAQCIVSQFRYMITSNSKFSNHICDNCAENIQEWMHFVNRFKKSQTHFSQLVADETEKLKSSENDSNVAIKDPLLSESEQEIVNKFPELKVASVPVVRLNPTDIQKYQQPSDTTTQHKDEQQHEDTQKVPGPNYSCDECDIKNMTLSHFKIHLAKTHLLNKEEISNHVPAFYQCKYCHKKYDVRWQLRQHEASHTLPYQCNICDKKLISSFKLKRHKVSHFEPQIPCPKCDKKFKANRYVRLHIKSQHSGDVRNFECGQCGKKFKSKDNLRVHIRFMHTFLSENSFKCAQCEKSFKFKDYLRLHINNTHQKSYKFSCIHCEQKFTSNTHLKTHIDSKHSNGIRKYQCNQCEKTYKCSDALRGHVWRVHSVSDKKSWKCEECEKCFDKRYALKRHKYTHVDPKYNCFHCGKKYKTKDYLKRHIESQHSGDGVRKYKCYICELMFKTKRTMCQHIKLIHTPHEKPWKCARCGKGFNFNCDLQKHNKIRPNFNSETKLCEGNTVQCKVKKTRVLKTGRYSCHLCSMKYKKVHMYKSHLIDFHHLSDEEVLKYVPDSFMCKYCQRKFRNPYLLKVHEGVHTLPYKCHFCDRRFARKYHITMHIICIHIKNKKIFCKHCGQKIKSMRMKRHIEKYHT